VVRKAVGPTYRGRRLRRQRATTLWALRARPSHRRCRPTPWRSSPGPTRCFRMPPVILWSLRTPPRLAAVLVHPPGQQSATVRLPPQRLTAVRAAPHRSTTWSAPSLKVAWQRKRPRPLRQQERLARPLPRRQVDPQAPRQIGPPLPHRVGPPPPRQVRPQPRPHADRSSVHWRAQPVPGAPRPRRLPVRSVRPRGEPGRTQVPTRFRSCRHQVHRYRYHRGQRSPGRGHSGRAHARRPHSHRPHPHRRHPDPRHPDPRHWHQRHPEPACAPRTSVRSGGLTAPMPGRRRGASEPRSGRKLPGRGRRMSGG
jgi:hypothetical protein